MHQLTVRGFDGDLANSIRRLAERDRTSLNQAVLKLLRRGAGLDDGTERTGTVGSSLDDLFGRWSRDEADEFNATLEVFEQVDESAWQ